MQQEVQGGREPDEVREADADYSHDAGPDTKPSDKVHRLFLNEGFKVPDNLVHDYRNAHGDTSVQTKSEGKIEPTTRRRVDKLLAVSWLEQQVGQLFLDTGRDNAKKAN